MTETHDPQKNAQIVSSLYLEYSEELLNFLKGVLRDPDLASEVLQTTFAKAIESVHTSRPETRKSWLFQVAYHTALELKKKDKRYTEILRQAAWHVTQDSNRKNHLPDDALLRSEIVKEIRTQLNELPAEQRMIVSLRIYEEKTFPEIAAELELPLGTVLTRMRLAMAQLGRKLKENE